MSANQKNTSIEGTIKKNQTRADQTKGLSTITETGTSNQHNVDSLRTLEIQLRAIWSQYISYLDQMGFDETAKALKRKYFRIYEDYQKNKNWRNVVAKN